MVKCKNSEFSCISLSSCLHAGLQILKIFFVLTPRNDVARKRVRDVRYTTFSWPLHIYLADRRRHLVGLTRSAGKNLELYKVIRWCLCFVHRRRIGKLPRSTLWADWHTVWCWAGHGSVQRCRTMFSRSTSCRRSPTRRRSSQAGSSPTASPFPEPPNVIWRRYSVRLSCVRISPLSWRRRRHDDNGHEMSLADSTRL